MPLRASAPRCALSEPCIHGPEPRFDPPARLPADDHRPPPDAPVPPPTAARDQQDRPPRDRAQAVAVRGVPPPLAHHRGRQRDRRLVLRRRAHGGRLALAGEAGGRCQGRRDARGARRRRVRGARRLEPLLRPRERHRPVLVRDRRLGVSHLAVRAAVRGQARHERGEPEPLSLGRLVPRPQDEARHKPQEDGGERQEAQAALCSVHPREHLGRVRRGRAQ